MNKYVAYIEMEAGSKVKHVFNKEKNKLEIHRILKEPLIEPFYYGFIKNSISGDKDPFDVFVLSYKRLSASDEIEIKPVGIIYCEDEMGEDNKILAVPIEEEKINDIKDIDKVLLYALCYQIEHNKDGIPGKWTKVKGIGNKDEATNIIEENMI